MSVVAVLKGGRSLEREVSLRSGARAEEALRSLGHEVVAVDVGSDLVDRLRERPIDAAFLALHGRGGEDGTVQELLELIGIPYTGSSVATCIRCSDKALTKYELVAAGIPTPDFYAFSDTAFKELGAGSALPEIEQRLEFPVVVKPARQGSALGIKFASSADDVPGALIAALSYDSKVILERYIAGRDLAVSVLDSDDGEPQALPAVEAIPVGEGNFDFEARYEIGRTEFVCPAELGPNTSERATEIALAAYHTLGCSGCARVDMILAENGELYVLEIDTIPGLTETSFLPQAAEAAGVSFEQLTERLLDQALGRVH